jgi:hypothetical protein
MPSRLGAAGAMGSLPPLVPSASLRPRQAKRGAGAPPPSDAELPLPPLQRNSVESGGSQARASSEDSLPRLDFRNAFTDGAAPRDDAPAQFESHQDDEPSAEPRPVPKAEPTSEAPPRPGLAIAAEAVGSMLVLYFAFDGHHSVFHGTANPFWIGLQGLAIFGIGRALAGLRR